MSGGGGGDEREGCTGCCLPVVWYREAYLWPAHSDCARLSSPCCGNAGCVFRPQRNTQETWPGWRIELVCFCSPAQVIGFIANYNSSYVLVMLTRLLLFDRSRFPWTCCVSAACEALQPPPPPPPGVPCSLRELDNIVKIIWISSNSSFMQIVLFFNYKYKLQSQNALIVTLSPQKSHPPGCQQKCVCVWCVVCLCWAPPPSMSSLHVYRNMTEEFDQEDLLYVTSNRSHLALHYSCDTLSIIYFT